MCSSPVSGFNSATDDGSEGYNTKTMEQDAKAAYIQAAEGSEEGEYIGILKGYLEVPEKNGYKLTDEVNRYGKQVAKAIE